MRWTALCLIATAGLAGQVRYARLGQVEGAVEMRLQPADAWRPAMRNTPLVQSSWLRTGTDSRVEVELDEGSVLRLAADSVCELSDYIRLSTGQRITQISLDRGTAYLTGQPEARDALMVAVPGAQAALKRGSRLRLEAQDRFSQIAVMEGDVRFSSSVGEVDLKEGHMARLEPSGRGRFYIYPQVSAIESDGWSEERDKLVAAGSSAHVLDLHYGLRDLDESGTWIDTDNYGSVWKPKVADTWIPYRDGKWQWYDGIGYTWIGAESWGWLPYHYGRWMRETPRGWFWVPGQSAKFQPGEVYWMRGVNLVGWGPLAPGEAWNATTVPLLYLNANTTFARFAPETREIDPAGFRSRPKDPLSTAAFAVELPALPLFPARLDFMGAVMRAGTVRLAPILPATRSVEEARVSRPPEIAQPPVRYAPPPEQPAYVVVPGPAPEPVVETYYVPVYTGVVVMNPPERKDPHHKKPPKPAEAEKPKEATQTPPAPKPAPAREDNTLPRSEQPISRAEQSGTKKNSNRE
jgi:hypothetical protein